MAPLTAMPVPKLCKSISDLVDFWSLPLLDLREDSAKVLLNSVPKWTSSPHPPHLNDSPGVPVGSTPQLHLVVTPMLQARAMVCARDAAAMLYT